MKSDRRHELQQNILASYLGRLNQSIEPYSRLIAVVLGTVIIAVIAYGLYVNKESEDRSDATLQLVLSANSRDAEVIATVGDSYPATAAGAWSRLFEADQYLSAGMRALYLNRDDALAQFEEARSAYKNALAAGDDRLMRSRAHYGLARVAESLGEIDEAIAAYGECVAVNESEAMVELAQQRIDSLSNTTTKEFLAWFSEQDFSPADPSLPPSLPSGVTLPDFPDLDLPNLGDKLPGSGDEDKMDLKDGGITMPGKETEEPAKGDAENADSKSDSDADPAPKTESSQTDPPKSDDASAESSDDASAESSDDASAESSDDAAVESSEDAAKGDSDSPEQPATDDPS